MPEAPPTRVDEAFARELDAADVLAPFREEFAIPTLGAPHPCVYLTGNSLGAMPRRVPELLLQETQDWARLGVEGHIDGRDPWLTYHEQFRGALGRLVGAMEHEVVAMNSLTVNLHLLMVSFYRPTRERFKIVIEDSAFPSDSYAVGSQAAFHAPARGFDPSKAIIRLKPRAGEETLRTGDIIAAIEREGPSIALVMLGAVNYLTGQWFDMPAITAAGQKAGAVVGWDLAHAAGNVPMRLHDWNADFAAWCSYKYLNGGPGAIAGAFVHERHTRGTGILPMPQFAGWWGNDVSTRFKMGPDFSPVASADRWALSNPPILSLTPLKASFDLFDRAGLDRLRTKSLSLTGYMESLIRERCHGRVTALTPADPVQRGCQLSLVVPGSARAMQRALLDRGVVCDLREPNIVRAAPVPLYNSFHDVWRFVDILSTLTRS
ncbi:MAG: kynureninase [Planctomycetota bacterium]